MRLTKRQLKRVIREEYSRLKRRGLIKEGSWSDDPIEDAYMCVSETCDLEEGSKQIVADLFYITEQFSMDGLLRLYVDERQGASEEVARAFKKFLTDLASIRPETAKQCATTFSSFWERHYIG